MATLALRKFTKPDFLNSIDPTGFLDFLRPWQNYLAGRGLILRREHAEPNLDLELLAQILLAPDGEAPKDLIDALYYVHETSSEEDMDALLDLATKRNVTVKLSPAATPADVAIQFWLVAPDLVRERHAENVAIRAKTYAYYGGLHANRDATFPTPAGDQLLALQTALGDWFHKHNRGRACSVFFFYRGKKVWILIRHGCPFKREASVKEDGQSSIEFYRPQINDILMYDVAADELAVHAQTERERELYLRCIGEFVFEDPAHFPAATKFSLAPLLSNGAASLLCEDIEGLEQIHLVEYRRWWGGSYKEIEIRKASDIFAALSGRNQTLAATSNIVGATFKLKFSDSTKRRTVAIRPPGYARYERNEDSELIERWLARRGFIREQEGDADDDESRVVLESAGRDSAGGHRSA